MYKYLALLTCWFLLASSGLADPIARVAAWNVASGRSDTGGTDIPKDRIERMAEVIAKSIKPDVLVMEEVWPVAAAADIAKASTAKGFPLEAVQIPAQKAEVVQLVSILKRPEVQITGVELIEGSEDLVEGDNPVEKTSRKAVLAKVKIGKFDFILVGVHLKSKRKEEGLGVEPIEARDRQCAAIYNRVHALTAAPKGEKDVMIVGDYNMTPEGEQEAPELSDAKNFATLNKDGLLRFISSETKGGTHVGYFKGGMHRSKLDGFAIAKATESEYRAGSFRILDAAALGLKETQFTNKKDKAFLSDHFPIMAEFDTTKDDD